MKPCAQHEHVSSRLATLRLSSSKRSLMRRAMFPVEMIATVLLAVQRSTIATMSPITASAPRLPFMPAVVLAMMKSMPPFFCTISNTPPASIVMMMSSPIERMPSPIEWNHSNTSKLPSSKPITPVIASPMVSTSITFMPAMAVERTAM